MTRELLDGIQDSYDTHDPTCESLPWFWWAHQGGRTALSDIESCLDCDAMFYVEGIVWAGEGELAPDDPDPVDLTLCACCARRRGYLIEISKYVGVVIIEQELPQ